MLKEEVKEEIRRKALKNALEYGRARESTVLNGVLFRFPELKAEMRALALEVKEEIERVNGLGSGEVKREAERYREGFEEERREREERSAKPRMELEGAVAASFKTRFPPEPNGYMHIGHAKAAFMERVFTDTYSGKMALYFDDTNPEAEKQEYVDSFKKDLEWLGIGFDEEYYASDNIGRMYEYASVLIERGRAYVCLCTQEEVRQGRAMGIGCAHRERPVEKNLELWKGMLESANEGILRLRGEMKSLNTTMRDPTLFRIKGSRHYRQAERYRVWPTYDFNTPVMDSIMGMTDVMRSKEYEQRDELYYAILGLLGLRKPRIHSFARLRISNNVTSKRKIRDLVKSGKIWGFDDPRLITIAGLRRRGIRPGAIREFVLRFGLSKTDSSMGIEMLLAENRKLIDRYSKRLFFVREPLRLEVEGMPDALEVRIRAHPTQELGYREYKLSNVFFINAYDAINLKKGDRLRLKDAFGVRIEGIEGKAVRASYSEGGMAEPVKLQWVNEAGYVRCKAFIIGDLLDGEAFNEKSMVAVEGLAEGYASSVGEGETVQFERLGFFKLDDKSEMGFLSI